MKTAFTFLLVFSVIFHYGQSDTLQWTNSHFYKPGPYNEYFVSGKLKTEGAYKILDSIECINCFDKSRNIRITKANSRLMKVGEWKEYYENGQLKSSGFYKGIHETYGITWPKDYGKSGTGVWVPGGYSEEYLKDKSWKYFNETGQLIREEFYFNGILADIESYER